MNVATILQFAKKYWKEILIVICLLLVIGKMRYDYNQLESAYTTTQESLQNQIAGLQEIHKKELEKREQALREYEQQLNDIEERYEMNQEELVILKAQKKKKYVKKFSEEPEMIVTEIESLFGFEYVE
jgi:predicted protein tyrosine phosphatase